MASDETRTGLESELSHAIDELQAALQHAAGATASIKALLPKVGAIGSLFDELDSVIRSGRQQIGPVTGDPPTAYTRPTLVAPTAASRPTPQPFVAPEPEWVSDPATTAIIGQPKTPESAEAASAVVIIEPETPESTQRAEAQGLTCFRLEFESRPGPLDLRTVDDAVSEHPAVRDVALLDYDGRKATLKVWIDGSASASDVQSALVDRSSQLFAPGNDVTIVALEDVA